MKTLNKELTAFLKEKGASLVGFADLGEIDTKAFKKGRVDLHFFPTTGILLSPE